MLRTFQKLVKQKHYFYIFLDVGLLHFTNRSSLAVLNIKGGLQMCPKKYNLSDDAMKTQDTKCRK